MHIESIELAWFRGASHGIQLKPNSKSLVVYGANGSGKSSFVDALEFVIANGRIGHLAHEYSGKRQEKGARNTHAPENELSRITLRFQDGSRVGVMEASDGKTSFESDPVDFLNAIQAWDLKRFILRQDEVANFIHATKGEKYSTLLPLLGLEALEFAAENLSQLVKEIGDRSGLSRMRQKIGELEEEVHLFFPEVSLEKAIAKLKELQTRYLPDQRLETFQELVNGITEAISSRIAEIEPAQHRYIILQQLHKEALATKMTELQEIEEKAARLFDELLNRRIAVLEPTKDFIVAIAQKQLEVINCPACGRSIAVTEFDQHVRFELEVLKSAREARDQAINARRVLHNAIEELKKRSEDEYLARWLEDPEQQDVSDAASRLISLDLSNYETKWSDAVRQILTMDIPVVARRIENAAKEAPQSTQQLMMGKNLLEACQRVAEVQKIKHKVAKVESVIGCLESAESEIRQLIKERTQVTLAQISTDIQRLWAKLHPDEPIEEVNLYSPEEAEKAIDISLKFFGVSQPSPRLTLSEGHRNSLGLCIFLALAMQEKDTSRPVVLDDVVSSLDREHRGMLVKVILEDLSDRQVILLTHDREWYTELRSRLPSLKWEFVLLRPWERPDTGIQLAASPYTLNDAKALVKSSPEAAGNRVRAIMDTELAIYAENLRISLPFARGDRNDKRTSYEFLERITSEATQKFRRRAGKEWLPHTDPIDVWKHCLTLLVSWANRASHSGSLVPSEAEELIALCEQALSEFRCKSCGDPVWIADQVKRKRMQCSCGELQWRYGS